MLPPRLHTGDPFLGSSASSQGRLPPAAITWPLSLFRAVCPEPVSRQKAQPKLNLTETVHTHSCRPAGTLTPV